MYQDKQATYSQDQAVTATAVSTNVYDAGVANRGIGDGEALELVVSVTEAAVSGGSSTVTIALQDSADNSSFADVLVSPAIPKASITLGAELFKAKLPTGLRRYTRLNYTVGTADLTAGKFTAFLALDRQANRAMPAGYAIT